MEQSQADSTMICRRCRRQPRSGRLQSEFGSGGNCVFDGSYSSSGGDGRGDGACGCSDTVDKVIHLCSVDDGVAPCGPPPGNWPWPDVWQSSAGSSPASTVKAQHYSVLSSMSTDVSNALLDKSDSIIQTLHSDTGQLQRDRHMCYFI